MNATAYSPSVFSSRSPMAFTISLPVGMSSLRAATAQSSKFCSGRVFWYSRLTSVVGPGLRQRCPGSDRRAGEGRDVGRGDVLESGGGGLLAAGERHHLGLAEVVEPVGELAQALDLILDLLAQVLVLHVRAELGQPGGLGVQLEGVPVVEQGTGRLREGCPLGQHGTRLHVAGEGTVGRLAHVLTVGLAAGPVVDDLEVVQRGLAGSGDLADEVGLPLLPGGLGRGLDRGRRGRIIGQNRPGDSSAGGHSRDHPDGDPRLGLAPGRVALGGLAGDPAGSLAHTVRP